MRAFVCGWCHEVYSAQALIINERMPLRLSYMYIANISLRINVYVRACMFDIKICGKNGNKLLICFFFLFSFSFSLSITTTTSSIAAAVATTAAVAINYCLYIF